jgi:hypothetical protein
MDTSIKLQLTANEILLLLEQKDLSWEDRVFVVGMLVLKELKKELETAREKNYEKKSRVCLGSECGYCEDCRG